jgi:hypothetical protein
MDKSPGSVTAGHVRTTALPRRETGRTGVLQLEVLVSKLVAVDGLAAGTVVVGEVATLEPMGSQHTMSAVALSLETAKIWRT